VVKSKAFEFPPMNQSHRSARLAWRSWHSNDSHLKIVIART
jgi:hypothetical protein